MASTSAVPITVPTVPAPTPAAVPAPAKTAAPGLRDIMAAQSTTAAPVAKVTTYSTVVSKSTPVPKPVVKAEEEMFWSSPTKEVPKTKTEDTLQGSFGGPRVPASFVKWAQKELKSITKSEGMNCD